MRVWFRVWNIIHTTGIRKGLTLKQLNVQIYFSYFKKIFRLSIPFWVLGYDREYAEYLQKASDEVRKNAS